MSRNILKGLARFNVWLALFLIPHQVLASGPPATMLVNVADTRAMEPGVGLLIANIYNEGYWLFGAMVVVVMVTEGLVLGLGMDRLIGLLGINLGKMDHHE